MLSTLSSHCDKPTWRTNSFPMRQTGLRVWRRLSLDIVHGYYIYVPSNVAYTLSSQLTRLQMICDVAARLIFSWMQNWSAGSCPELGFEVAAFVRSCLNGMALGYLESEIHLVTDVLKVDPAFDLELNSVRRPTLEDRYLTNSTNALPFSVNNYESFKVRPLANYMYL